MEQVTEQELADARYNLAMEILESENASKIVTAMNTLTLLQAHRASEYHRKAKKSDNKRKRRKQQAQARAWKLAADEFYTVTMCAIYTHQDQQTGN